jgi:hypothetical protein
MPIGLRSHSVSVLLLGAAISVCNFGLVQGYQTPLTDEEIAAQREQELASALASKACACSAPQTKPPGGNSPLNMT